MSYRKDEPYWCAMAGDRRSRRGLMRGRPMHEEISLIADPWQKEAPRAPTKNKSLTRQNHKPKN